MQLSYMLLEDLRIDGYACVKKQTGLDFQQLTMVLTKLAKWHAATAVLNNQVR